MVLACADRQFRSRVQPAVLRGWCCNWVKQYHCIDEGFEGVLAGADRQFRLDVVISSIDGIGVVIG
jgi:hypothetical protein